jgi:hypothetical protein
MGLTPLDPRPFDAVHLWHRGAGSRRRCVQTWLQGLWVALFAAKKFIIIGIIALVVAIKKFFGKGQNITES